MFIVHIKHISLLTDHLMWLYSFDQASRDEYCQLEMYLWSNFKISWDKESLVTKVFVPWYTLLIYFYQSCLYLSILDIIYSGISFVFSHGHNNIANPYYCNETIDQLQGNDWTYQSSNHIMSFKVRQAITLLALLAIVIMIQFRKV